MEKPDVLYTIDRFKEDVDAEIPPWYIQALKGKWAEHKIDYWNFNAYCFPSLRPAIVTRDESPNVGESLDWDRACTYKGFIFWIPKN